jgi:hypothetical protein
MPLFGGGGGGGGAHPDLATHDSMGLVTDAILATHDASAVAHAAAIDAALAGVLTQSPDYLANYAFAYDEFFGSGTTDGQVGSLGWRITVDAGASGTVIPHTVVQTNHPGVYTLGTGTAIDGRAAINFTHNQMEGSPEFVMEWRVNVVALAVNDVNEGIVRVGLMDSNTATEPTDGFYFEYDVNVSPNWQAVTADGGTRTKTVTTVAAAAATWIVLKVVNDGAGNAVFYIDGAAVATISTNHPDTADAYGPAIHCVKTNIVGTTALSLRVDTFWLLWAVTR